jgi:hypothetical protein
MTNQERDEQQSDDARNNSQGMTGDPGRTPGKAEGDERTADEDLKRQGGGASS